MTGLIQVPFIGRKVRQAQQEIERLRAQAEALKKELELEARDEALKIRQQAEQEIRERRRELQQQERRLAQKDDQYERKLESAERKEQGLTQKQQEIEKVRVQVEEVRSQELERLQSIAQLTTNDARDLLLKRVDADLEQEKARRIYELQQQVQEDADFKARKAITLAVQRLTSDVVSETTGTVVHLPTDEMKGRLIGREGRNIRALENLTGVDLIVDDTPEAVTLSCFDPVRREIARVTLLKLMQDGRIHPARIEEMVERAQKEIDETIQREGEQAVYETGVQNLNRDVVKLLGRLKYRFSYGQNVLKHSIEVGHLAGIMAAEIGAKVQVAKAAGLLHDLGKALSHEVEGPHAEIGGDIARKYGVPLDVARAIEEHHLEGENVNVEAFLVAAADAISGGRPGARRDTVEHYIKRIRALEETALTFPGVEKCYAIQAGREVRIMVKPDQIDDIAAAKLAHDIVRKIEETQVYPGQIKITVIRETRAVDYAR